MNIAQLRDELADMLEQRPWIRDLRIQHLTGSGFAFVTGIKRLDYPGLSYELTDNGNGPDLTVATAIEYLDDFLGRDPVAAQFTVYCGGGSIGHIEAGGASVDLRVDKPMRGTPRLLQIEYVTELDAQRKAAAA